MRDIVLARLDKTRPALVMTREIAIPMLSNITVAPITSTIRGIATEVLLGQRNGLDRECVASMDNLATIQKRDIGRVIGFFLEDQEQELSRALQAAFDLEDTESGL